MKTNIDNTARSQAGSALLGSIILLAVLVAVAATFAIQSERWMEQSKAFERQGATYDIARTLVQSTDCQLTQAQSTGQFVALKNGNDETILPANANGTKIASGLLAKFRFRAVATPGSPGIRLEVNRSLDNSTDASKGWAPLFLNRSTKVILCL